MQSYYKFEMFFLANKSGSCGFSLRFNFVAKKHFILKNGASNFQKKKKNDAS
jgi:hypothetical protein